MHMQVKIKFKEPEQVSNKKDLACKIIDIAVPLDLSVTSKSKDKRIDYMVPLSELQRIYPRYHYQIIPVVIGALGIVT